MIRNKNHKRNHSQVAQKGDQGLEVMRLGGK
jgi:hypothetical protein